MTLDEIAREEDIEKAVKNHKNWSTMKKALDQVGKTSPKIAKDVAKALDIPVRDVNKVLDNFKLTL